MKILTDDLLNCLIDDYCSVYSCNAVGDLRLNRVGLYNKKTIDIGDNISFFDYVSYFRNKIHPSEIAIFDHIFDMDLFSKKIIIHDKFNIIFRLNLFSNGYKYYEFKLIFNKDKNFEPMFIWRETGRSYDLLNESIKLISGEYYTIVKVDLTDDTYTEIKFNSQVQYDNISELCKNYASNENVYFDDIVDFLKFTSNNNLKSLFKSSNDNKEVFRYRILCSDGTFRWVAMEVVPCSDYTLDKQVIMIYIRDIHDDYIHKLMEERKLYYLATHDTLTGLNNKLAYMNTAATISTNDSVGILLVKINNPNSDIVKETSSKITSIFREIECYRLDYDEFVVLISGISEQKFMDKKNKLLELLNDNIKVGNCWSSQSINLNIMLNHAENMICSEE